MKYWLGLDTSCYTTSLAMAPETGEPLSQRRLLEVPAGERGLQQSKGVFQHLQQLPEQYRLLLMQPHMDEWELAGIAVSSCPRPVEGSYMPVFTVGERFAEFLAASHHIPLFRTSHQEGHIMAGLHTAHGPQSDQFLAIHLSGGTTELLKVTRGIGTLELKLLSGSEDLHAGQMVDRVAVSMGLPFPGGVALEALALDWHGKTTPIPSVVHGLSCSFSGPESAAQRQIAAGVEKNAVACAVFDCITCTLSKLIETAVAQTGLRQVLLVGGVAANKLVRRDLPTKTSAELYFASPALSSDNAVGVALLGREQAHGASLDGRTDQPLR